MTVIESNPNAIKGVDLSIGGSKGDGLWDEIWVNKFSNRVVISTTSSSRNATAASDEFKAICLNSSSPPSNKYPSSSPPTPAAVIVNTGESHL